MPTESGRHPLAEAYAVTAWRPGELIGNAEVIYVDSAMATVMARSMPLETILHHRDNPAKHMTLEDLAELHAWVASVEEVDQILFDLAGGQ